MAATDFKDYYQILGVSKTASADDIKSAFRKLARKYHPDVNAGNPTAETRFKEINEAHEVLSDPEKRRKYDQFGQYWQQAGGAAGAGGAGGVNFDQYGSFDDFINELLGRFGGSQGGYNAASQGFGGFNSGFNSGFNTSGYGNYSQPGQDVEAQLTLSFSEAFHGTQKRLQQGRDTLTVRIPAGAKPGSRIRVKGKGQPSPLSAQRGDLYLIVDLQPHPFFRLENDKLVCEVPISPVEAALGAQIDVPTPDGTVAMTIPPGVSSGQSLRLRGKGWCDRNQNRGDQIVRLKIVTPKTLSDPERQCYEQLQQVSNFAPRQSLQDIKL